MAAVIAHAIAWILASVLVDAAWADAERLIIARAGDVPILLTAPHGGGEVVPDVPVRRTGITGTDAHTLEVTEALATHLERALGVKPYLVAARFSRKYIDANRAEADAFESPHAKPAYEAYHQRIRAFVAQIRERFPRGGLLLDIHGQSQEPRTVLRGTRNGATVRALVRTQGPAAVIGPNSVFGVVQRRGFTVFPPNTPIGTPPEDARYSGGYTVQTYGSNTPDGIDAMQIEIGRAIRTDPALIAALADGIAAFTRAYLRPNP